MPTPRQILVPLLLAAAGTAASGTVAAAATLTGTVVGRPVVAPTSVVVPVLLSSAGERAAGTAVARVRVPRTGGLRTPNTRLAPGDLRIGDRVSATVARITVRPRARALRITRRATTPSFARMDGRRRAATAAVTTAIVQTERVPADPMSVLDPATPASSTFGLREQLRAVRTDLNLLIASLRASADSFDATVASIIAGRPTDAGRRAAAERRQRATLARLATDATAGREAARALDDAVARLDETMNAVGEPSTTPLPLEGVAAVSTLLYAVLDLLRA